MGSQKPKHQASAEVKLLFKQLRSSYSDDDVVQHLSTETSNPPFRSSVLPRRLDARPLRLQTGCREQSNYVNIEFRVMVEDVVPV